MDTFFKKQTDLTAAKVKIYKEYITGYLPKILQTFQQCLIADLFCGAGKNGGLDGSPLVLFNQAEYILNDPVVNRGKPKINILFNDKEKKNTDDLKLQLKNITHSSINIQPIENLDFQTLLPKILHKFAKYSMPKFFFLDPFKYSDVSIEDLASLMNLKNTEVFLFIPIFHSYRFANQQDFPEGHQTRKFIESFTTKGMADYNGIDDFMQSIKTKLKDKLNLEYVRPVLLDGGSCKNAIFLLTKHQAGMLLMNKIALKQSDDGKGVNIQKQLSGQADLFGTQGTTRLDMFAKRLKRELIARGKMSNAEIVKFSIKEEFAPKYALDVLKELRSNKKLTVLKGKTIITNNTQKWNIAESIQKETIFSYDN